MATMEMAKYIFIKKNCILYKFFADSPKSVSSQRQTLPFKDRRTAQKTLMHHVKFLGIFILSLLHISSFFFLKLQLYSIHNTSYLSQKAL